MSYSDGAVGTPRATVLQFGQRESWTQKVPAIRPALFNTLFYENCSFCDSRNPMTNLVSWRLLPMGVLASFFARNSLIINK